MYLHVGNGVVVRKNEIVCICDMDNSTASYRTRKFLSQAEKESNVINSCGSDLPKSFVVCYNKRRGQKVILSQLNSSTLLKRFDSPFQIE